jgi:cellulose biosynthesis protein BcsQ
MNLAAATALTGTRVLLLDADPLSNISTALNLAQHPQRQALRPAGIDLPGVLVPNLIPGLDVFSPYDEGTCTDEDFARLLRALTAPPARKCYGCIIVDVPPFLGGSASELLASCDDFLLVMRAEESAHRTLPAFMELVHRSSRDGRALPMRGILLTLPQGEQPGCRLERELRGRFGTRVLPEVIPHDDNIGKALCTGRVCSQMYPDSPASQQYHQLVAKLNLPDETSPSVGLDEILQALREASELAGPPASATTSPSPISAETLIQTNAATLKAPLVPPSAEPVKPASPGHRPRRMNRSGESLRPPRPERGIPSPSVSPIRLKVVPAQERSESEEYDPSSVVPAPCPQNTTHALAQLWPLWILLGAVLGGGIRLLPPSPTLLQILLSMGVALLVVVVLFILRAQRRAASSAAGKTHSWLPKRRAKESESRSNARQDVLSARLAALASNSQRARRAAENN